MSFIDLLPHQKKAKQEIVSILKKKKLCYLAGSTRSGKTLTVLFSAEEFEEKKYNGVVCFYIKDNREEEENQDDEFPF